jgi:hypothetical protein
MSYRLLYFPSCVMDYLMCIEEISYANLCCDIELVLCLEDEIGNFLVVHILGTPL